MTADPKITLALVQQLIARQCPQWSHLKITPVAHGGWDNRTFHLGPQMSVRLPSAARYAAQTQKEHIWLPQIAPMLPLAIPRSKFVGQPTNDYPFAWSVRDWIEGEDAQTC